MIVDAHTHLFRDREMARLWLGHDPGGRTGQLQELGETMRVAGIDQAVVLLFHLSQETYELLLGRGASPAEAREATRDEMCAYNRWGCDASQMDGRLLPFVGVDPRFLEPDEIRDSIADGLAHGARGVKIIPTRFKCYADDPSLAPVFDACAALDVPMLSQSGSFGRAPDSKAEPFGRPRRFQTVLERHPELRIILAHLGDGYEAEIAELTRRFPNVYTDTALRLSGLDRPGRWSSGRLVDAIRSIGVDRVLFGTNYPFVDPVVYLARLRALPFTEDEAQLIVGGNFERCIAK